MNRRRLRVLLPVMAAVHLAHIAMFWDSPARRIALGPQVARWRESIVLAHATTLPLIAGLIFIVYFARRERLLSLAGPATAAIYVAHGALCSSFDQQVAANLTPFVGYCLGAAVVLILRPRVAITLYVLGGTMMALGLTVMQADRAVRWANLPNCVTVSVLSAALSWLAYVARRRDFGQRRTIDRQREELARLNQGLEQRVREQVAEIVARAEEVDRLNAQLQAQVLARSGELALALARLARNRTAEGALRPGVVLGERFVIGEILGSGGMGAVYAGVDRSTDDRVAIKTVQTTSSYGLDTIRLFIQEVRAAATITHPGVVRMLHVDVSEDGLLYQVQELVKGSVLAKSLATPWPAADAARVGSVLCDALAAAHAGGVVHRDIKPENVMLTPVSPGLKLLDFGIAKLRDNVGGVEGTRADIVMGTPAYMAPEMCTGQGPMTGLADVYAVGILLFQLVTGRLPFDGSSPQALMHSHVLTPAPDVRSFVATLPADLAQVIARCLEKDPSQRLTAAELSGKLQAIADAAGARPLEEIARTVRTSTPSSSVPISIDATATSPLVRRSGGSVV